MVMSMLESQKTENLERKYSIDNCKQVSLPKISDPRGNLSFIEFPQHLPFPIKRVYYLYGVPEGAERAGHAHKKLYQLFIAVSGKFTIEIDDGREAKSIVLDQPNQGLLLTPMIWRVVKNFSKDAVCMVLASELYDPNDYLSNYSEFREMTNSSHD